MNHPVPPQCAVQDPNSFSQQRIPLQQLFCWEKSPQEKEKGGKKYLPKQRNACPVRPYKDWIPGFPKERKYLYFLQALTTRNEITANVKLNPLSPGCYLEKTPIVIQKVCTYLGQISREKRAKQWAFPGTCWGKSTYETTVFVETMYSTSLVQGFMKLNQRLRNVIKEPSFILNL